MAIVIWVADSAGSILRLHDVRYARLFFDIDNAVTDKGYVLRKQKVYAIYMDDGMPLKYLVNAPRRAPFNVFYKC